MARSPRLVAYIGSLTWLVVVGCSSRSTLEPISGGSSGGAASGTASSSSGTATCTSDAPCDDGSFCNGAEACVAGACVAGTPPSCDDGIVCTIEACDEAGASCKHTPSNSLCPPGQLCIVQQGGCVAAGTPCVSSAPCQDGDLCNGVEVCVNGLCQPGTPMDCNDDIACTIDSCNPGTGQCAHAANDSNCPPGQTCDATLGCGNDCQVKTCYGKIYQCGDCLDDDGDGLVDSADPDCLGPCHNNEQGFSNSLPDMWAKCRTDCYFDQDSGSGNDDCYWDHRCDPLEVAPQYYPESWSGAQCSYNPAYKLTPTLSCSQAMTTQSQTCLDSCAPVVPNGCDCFGCCAIPVPNTSTTVTVWLGSEDGNGNGSCTLDSITDPTKCAPCTQVQGACLNTCEHCELCLGKPTLPPDCATQTCPAGKQRCGLPGQAPCPNGSYCITGCCQPTPSY